MPNTQQFWTISINQKKLSFDPRIVVLALSSFSAILIIGFSITTLSVPTLKPYTTTTKHALRFTFGAYEDRQKSKDNSRCPDILLGMAQGKWRRRVLSDQEQNDIDSYLREERMAFYLPHNFQRLDLKCGNVSYEHAPLYRHMWFKAICDAHGSTPCCKNNRCVWAAQQDCQCEDCYDERQTIHAEYAQWIPKDRRCAVDTFSAEQACAVLRGTNLEFVGDSFIRHMFAATVIRLSGDTEFSTLKKPVPSFIRQICRGMHQFTALQCREHLKEEHSLCNNTVQLRYTQVFPAIDFLVVPQVLDRAFRSPRSLLVMGMGIHDDFKFDTVRRGFLLPVLNLRQYMARFPRDTSRDDVYIDLGSVRTNFTAHNLTLCSLIERNIKSVSASWSNLQALVKAKFLDESFLAFIKKLRKRNQTEQSKSQHTALNDNNAVKWANAEKVPRDPIIFQDLPDQNLKMQRLPPNILWVGTHAPGLLKASKFVRQTAKGVFDYNKKVLKLLEKWKIPFMDTFTFSNGTVSYDGTHYGWGINMMKVNMLVHYIRDDLVNSNRWS